MKENTKCFKISDIDIDKIRVSENKLCSKEHNSHKYYVFYKHDNEYIPLRIILKDVVGYYNDYKGNRKYDVNYSANRMIFRLDDDDSVDKVYAIFDHIEEKLNIDVNNFTYESKKGEEYLKTNVSDETSFRKDKDTKINRIANENTKYNCRVLLQIQAIYYSMKDNDDDIKYYPQVLLAQCVYNVFSNILIHEDLGFTDTEPDSKSNDGDESEEEINENIVLDE